MNQNVVELSFVPVAQAGDLVSQIVERIKEAILNGQLRPGDQLPNEATLCEQFGVSRSSVREAIKTLAAVGVVEIRRGNGTFVSATSLDGPMEMLSLAFMLTPTRRQHLVELRQIVERACGRLVILHADEHDIASLDDQVTRFETAIGAKADPRTLRQLDVEFHELLFDKTNNPIFAKLGKALLHAFAMSMQRALVDEAVDDAALRDHRDLVAAIRSRSEDEFNTIVDRSLETWKAHLSRSPLADEDEGQK